MVVKLVLVIVDDDERVVSSLAALIDAGLHVRTCSSSDEALALLETTPDAFSALIIDSPLPYDRSSREIVRCARAIRPGLAVLLLDDSPPCAVDSQQRIGVPRLNKPVSPATLASTVAGLVALDAPAPVRPRPDTRHLNGGSACTLRDAWISAQMSRFPASGAYPSGAPAV